MITVRIDVTKIDKSKLVKGEKGTWYDMVLIPKKTEYSDYMVVESITKEEREAGVKSTILGNGKTLQKRTPEPDEVPAKLEEQSDGLPW